MEEVGYLITDAENLDQEGQSVLEFLMFLPLFLGLTTLLLRVNTAIQMSIVDQQYARAQALFIAQNSAYYPDRPAKQARLIQQSSNQLVVGVSDNSTEENQEYSPIASVQLVARNKNSTASNEAGEPTNARAFVRVRNTVTLCTQNLYALGYIRPETPPDGNFCGSSLKYLEN